MTLTEPACTRPTRPAPTGAAPVPAPCWLCGGSGEDSVTGEPCTRCDGGGFEFARFDLLPSRTCELRRVRFESGRDGVHTLRVWMVCKKATWRVWPDEDTYTVCETANDWGGRSFLLHKIGSVPARSHNVFLGRGASCECEGRTFETSAKHNQKAFEANQRVFPTLGCIHKDCLHALLLAGWFDLPKLKE